MTNIIEHTYTALANTGELHLTEKDYSTNYLGRCKSYYAYLKSTGRQASTEVLLKLWTQLRKAEQEGNANHKKWCGTFLEPSGLGDVGYIGWYTLTPCTGPSLRNCFVKQHRVL